MANSDAGMSSRNVRAYKFEVFLNFRGKDTRRGFISFLYRDLDEKCIDVFMDEERIRVGEEIDGKLRQAINGSQIYIPVFSKNYAQSEWCLRELAIMLDNISNSKEKIILPIFYDVKPKDVKLETPLYRTALEEHKIKFPREVESWETALEKVQHTRGWELPEYKSEAVLVDLVVVRVLQSLKRNNNFVTKDFFGIEGQVAKVLELLDVNCSDEVVLLGLHGIGGIGKTTLARLVYKELSSRFGKWCAFLDDIREMSEKEGLVWLQKKLLTEIASSNSTTIISGVDHGRERIEETLRNKKVLIILDDVDKKEQIENLIGQRKLHPGTRIIITTREKSVLETFQQNLAREMEMNSDHALRILSHEMESMSIDDAHELFKKHAFPEGSMAKDFKRYLGDIVFRIGGIPLAIKVIGSLFCGKPTLEWEKTSKQLEDAALRPVQEKLMISYGDLSYRQTEIFLDIACLFINEDMMNTIYMWKALAFDPDKEINVLVKMSLIKINDNNKFWMHDQLRDLGREIVHKKSPQKLGSRLRITEENLDFIINNKSKEAVEALDLQGWNSHISISHEEIARFERLRFLRLSNGTLHGDSIVNLPNLKWISWHSPSPDFSVDRMHSNKLVVLQLFNNQFTDDSKVWHLLEMATKLKNLALVECHGITRTPDLSKCQDLERLTFDYCKSLKEIDGVIGKLTCLVDLNITHCGLVERVPDDIRQLVNLQRFSLKSCDKVRTLPTSIGHLTSLQKLDLSNTSITSLRDSIGKLSCLSDLNLLGSEITEIPDEIEELVELRDLCLKDTKIKQLSGSIGKLKSLCTLDLSSHESTELDSNGWNFPKEIGMLNKLEKLYLGHRVELEGEIPDEIGFLSSLKVLDLCRTSISGVPGTINKLSCLSTLDLRWCDKITALPDLPASLLHLRVESRSLQVVPNLSKLTNLVELVLSNGSNYEDLSNQKHKYDSCWIDLHWIGRLSKLKKLELCLLNFVAPPMELGPLSLLEDLTWGSLDLKLLTQLPPSLLSLELVNISSTGSLLSKLQIPSNLTLRLSRLQEIQLNGLSQLQHLHLDRCELWRSSIPSSLRTLNVINCPNMIEIQSLGMLALLEELSIDDCRSISRIVLGGEVLDQSESSSSESTYCSLGVHLTNAFKKLKRLRLRSCTNLLYIQVNSTLLSLQYILIESCDAMRKLSGISKLKDLRHLDIDKCSRLEAVEGLNELEFLSGLDVKNCTSLERLLDISNSKIPDECLIRVSHCRDSLDSSSRDCRIPFKCYKKMMAQQGAPQLQTSKEAKLEGGAEEPITKLQLQFHPSASSQDHDISKEPPIDNFMEGTPPGNQIQTRRQDSNHLSLSCPITFSDRFKTCLVSILECVCSCDFSSFKAEFFEGQNRRSI
ncbi:hypothetical protein ACJRO7_015359 [Eucalyptus globulus]|uniref:TIR domain-containing protein n=1 Tax=Eucalyptus globulus TaxID=34317 RepID=A0ABD3L498_EUCGL